MYRPPNANSQLFIEKYVAYLNSVGKNEIYLIGDFNFDLSKKQNSDVGKFIDTNSCFGLLHLITNPTRLNHRNSSILDNFLTNDINRNKNSYILIDDTTDHLAILCIVKFGTKQCYRNRK